MTFAIWQHNETNVHCTHRYVYVQLRKSKVAVIPEPSDVLGGGVMILRCKNSSPFRGRIIKIQSKNANLNLLHDSVVGLEKEIEYAILRDEFLT